MIAAKYGNTNQLHVAQNYVFRFADRLPSIVVNELVHAGEMGGRSPDEILTALLHHLKVFHRSSSETQKVFTFRPKSRRRQLPPGLNAAKCGITNSFVNSAYPANDLHEHNFKA